VIIKLLKWVIAIALGVGTWILLDLIFLKVFGESSGRLIWFAFPVIAVSAHLMGVFANDDE